MNTKIQKSQHTSGEWASIASPMQVVTHNKVIANLNYEGLEHSEVIANARLIASAPSLLSTLEESREYIALILESSDDDGEVNLLLRIDQAIAKAKGE